MVPPLFGAYFDKISVGPISPGLTALTGAKVDLSTRPDALPEEVVKFFESEVGVWEIRVQLCTDLDTVPIEDASVIWSEEPRPYVAVARITVPAQSA